jgi:MFS family permease
MVFSERGEPAGRLHSAAIAVVAGAVVISAAMGIRQTFGLFVGSYPAAHDLPVATIAFAIALHNLVWGFAQPIAGAAADRHGSAPVVGVGAVLFAAGLTLPALVPTGPMLVLGIGVLVGAGISCTSFGVVLTAVGRSVPAERRSAALGLVSAGGSAGQVLLVPLAQGVTALSGPSVALMALAGCMLAVAPLGLVLDRGERAGGGGPAAVGAAGGPAMPLRAAVAQALRNRGYCLLTLGFFTCGFQLAFIATHLPAYLTLCGVATGMGATALALIGLFNMVGSWGCGWLGGRYPQPRLLGWLYLIRGAAIAAFFLAPKTEAAVILFAAVMGLTWLGTVPLTSGLVAKVFGTRHLGTLFGLCFLSHQIGSFLGSWLGGWVFDATGSYGAVWIATAVAGLVAALLHFPIDDTPVARAAPLPAGD